MMTCGDFYSGKQNSRAYYIMVGFEKWIKENPNVVHLLSKDIKFDAFDLVIRQKNQSLINLVAKIYKMVEDKEIFINPLMDLIALSKYKEVIYIDFTIMSIFIFFFMLSIFFNHFTFPLFVSYISIMIFLIFYLLNIKTYLFFFLFYRLD